MWENDEMLPLPSMPFISFSFFWPWGRLLLWACALPPQITHTNEHESRQGGREPVKGSWRGGGYKGLMGKLGACTHRASRSKHALSLSGGERLGMGDRKHERRGNRPSFAFPQAGDPARCDTVCGSRCSCDG